MKEHLGESERTDQSQLIVWRISFVRKGIFSEYSADEIIQNLKYKGKKNKKVLYKTPMAQNKTKQVKFKPLSKYMHLKDKKEEYQMIFQSDISRREY